MSGSITCKTPYSWAFISFRTPPVAVYISEIFILSAILLIFGVTMALTLSTLARIGTELKRNTDALNRILDRLEKQNRRDSNNSGPNA